MSTPSTTTPAEGVPVAYAIPLNTPTNAYAELPQPEFAQAPMAIPVHEGVNELDSSDASGLNLRWPCRRAAISQLLYFSISYALFVPPIGPYIIALCSSIVGIYGTSIDVSNKHLRAVAGFGAINACLVIYFMVYLAIISIAAVVVGEIIDFIDFFLSIVNVPVLLLAASKASAYQHELSTHVVGGITRVQTIQTVRS